jgi:2-deoxy-D-gluconate 3-dehydrogenase
MGEVDLSGQVALVTGASRGLGRTLALALAGAGADIAIAARSESALQSVADEIRALGRRAIAVPTDVTVTAEVDGLVRHTLDELGSVDILVNNSGVFDAGKLIDTSDEAWDRVVNTNLRGTFLCTRAVGRFLIARGEGGKVINIASNFGLIGLPQMAAYCASKAAVIHFTRAVALEWAGSGVQVNAIAPGYFATEINAEMRGDPAQLDKVLRRIPARRVAEPEELTPIALYLASPASNFVTGTTIVIDGGQAAS